MPAAVESDHEGHPFSHCGQHGERGNESVVTLNMDDIAIAFHHFSIDRRSEIIVAALGPCTDPPDPHASRDFGGRQPVGSVRRQNPYGMTARAKTFANLVNVSFDPAQIWQIPGRDHQDPQCLHGVQDLIAALPSIGLLRSPLSVEKPLHCPPRLAGGAAPGSRMRQIVRE